MFTTRPALDDFIASLERVDFEHESADTIASLLTQSRLTAATLHTYVRFEPGRYTRNLIVRTNAFELLVLCWSPGSASSIHDHGGRRCFMLVQSGTLSVEDFELLSGGRCQGYARIRSVSSTLLRPGAIDVRSARRDLHRVSAALEPAISLHVYAKPMDRFFTFDPANRSCRAAVPRDESALRVLTPTTTVTLLEAAAGVRPSES